MCVGFRFFFLVLTAILAIEKRAAQGGALVQEHSRGEQYFCRA